MASATVSPPNLAPPPQDGAGPVKSDAAVDMSKPAQPNAGLPQDALALVGDASKGVSPALPVKGVSQPYTRPITALAPVGPPVLALEHMLPGIKTGDVPRLFEYKLIPVKEALYVEEHMVDYPDDALDPWLSNFKWIEWALKIMDRYFILLAPPSRMHLDQDKNLEVPVDYFKQLGLDWLSKQNSTLPLEYGPNTRREMTRWRNGGGHGFQTIQVGGEDIIDNFPVGIHPVDYRIWRMMEDAPKAYFRHGPAAYRALWDVFQQLLRTQTRYLAPLPGTDFSYKYHYYLNMPGIYPGARAGRGVLQGEASERPDYLRGAFNSLLTTHALREPIFAQVAAQIRMVELPYRVQNAQSAVTAASTAVGASATSAPDFLDLVNGLSEGSAREALTAMVAAAMGQPIELSYSTAPTLTTFIECLFWKLFPAWMFTQSARISIEQVLHNFMFMHTTLLNAGARLISSTDDLRLKPYEPERFNGAVRALRYHNSIRLRVIQEYVATWGNATIIGIPAGIAEYFRADRAILGFRMHDLHNPDAESDRSAQLADVMAALINNITAIKAAGGQNGSKIRGLMTHVAAVFNPGTSKFMYGLTQCQEAVMYNPLALPTDNLGDIRTGTLLRPYSCLSALRLCTFEAEVDVQRSPSWIYMMPLYDRAISRLASTQTVLRRVGLPRKFNKPKAIRKAAFNAHKPELTRVGLANYLDPDKSSLALLREQDGKMTADFGDYVSPEYEQALALAAVARAAFERLHTVPGFAMVFSRNARHQVDEALLGTNDGGVALCFTTAGAGIPIVARHDHTTLSQAIVNRTLYADIQRAEAAGGAIQFDIRVKFKPHRLTSRDQSYKVDKLVSAPWRWTDGLDGYLQMTELIIPYALRTDISDWSTDSLTSAEDARAMYPLFVPNTPLWEIPGLRRTDVARYVNEFTSRLEAYNFNDPQSQSRQVTRLEPADMIAANIRATAEKRYYAVTAAE